MPRANKASTNLSILIGLYRAMEQTDDPAKIRALEGAVCEIVPDLMPEEVAFFRAMALSNPE